MDDRKHTKLQAPEKADTSPCSSPQGNREESEYHLGTRPKQTALPLDATLPDLCTGFTMVRRSAAGTIKRSTSGVCLAALRAFGWRRFGTAVAAVLAVSMAYHVVFGQNGLTAYQHKREDSRELERQGKLLLRENDALKGHIARLASDPNAIEHQAREELHYTRPGEVIYTLPTSPNAVK